MVALHDSSQSWQAEVLQFSELALWRHGLKLEFEEDGKHVPLQ